MSGRENFYYFAGHYLAESYFARHCPAERFFLNILVDMSGRELFCWTLSGKECFFLYFARHVRQRIILLDIVKNFI